MINVISTCLLENNKRQKKKIGNTILEWNFQRAFQWFHISKYKYLWKILKHHASENLILLSSGGGVERRNRSCPYRLGYSFLQLYITEQRLNSNSDWGQVCPTQSEGGQRGGGGCPPAVSCWLSLHVLFAGELRHNTYTFSVCHPNRNN